MKKDYKSFRRINEFKKRMLKLGIYYDCNELLNLNDTLHFFDSHHLNQDGVEIFNTELIKVLDSINY